MDFLIIICYVWLVYDSICFIKCILDISVMVFINYVYKIWLEDGNNIIVKFFYFGKYEYFVEDYMIINVFSNNLLVCYENFFLCFLMKGN